MHKKKRNNNNKKKIKKKLFIHPVLSSLVYIPVSYIYWPKCPTPRPSTHTHTHPSKEDTKCHSNSNQKKITFFLLRTLERFCFSLLPKFFLFEFLAKILKKFSFPFFFGLKISLIGKLLLDLLRDNGLLYSPQTEHPFFKKITI